MTDTAEQYAEYVSDLQDELYQERGIRSRPNGKEYISFVYEMSLQLFDKLPEPDDVPEIFSLLEQSNTHTGAAALRLALMA